MRSLYHKRGKGSARKGIYFPSSGSGYNPCKAGQDDVIVLDRTSCDHYTIFIPLKEGKDVLENHARELTPARAKVILKEEE